MINSLEIPFKVEEIEDKINFCLKKITEEAIRTIHFNGGFIDLRNSPIGPLEVSSREEKSKIKTAWGLFENEIVLISKEGLEYQLKEYLRYEVPICFSDKLPKNSIKQGYVGANVTVYNNLIDITLIYPVTIVIGDLNVKPKDEYKLKLNSNLGEMRYVANEIVKQQRENDGQIEIAKILSYGYDIRVLPIDEKTSVVMIYDKGQSGLIFIFGSKK